MASLVNQPRFFRLLNLLVLLIVLVMRLTNSSWDDGNGEMVETIMSLQWYSCGTNSLDELLQKNKSPCPNQLFQIPLPWLRVHVYLHLVKFSAHSAFPAWFDLAQPPQAGKLCPLRLWGPHNFSWGCGNTSWWFWWFGRGLRGPVWRRGCNLWWRSMVCWFGATGGPLSSTQFGHLCLHPFVGLDPGNKWRNTSVLQMYDVRKRIWM